ncbi:TrmH family RNA methyltransferase [Radiobacillus sp. PE A8.2]|uniref:TrmH family RNA methyltransferase n=1 Tax=Radiobacillus sp. PE A8.2 TaxID=3380349 RepID=UPI00388FBDD3
MITSVQNNKVKQWKKLKMKKERQKQGVFLVEGFHLVEEAIKSQWNVQEVIVQQGVEVPDYVQDIEVHELTDNVFQAIAETKTPQGIAAVVGMKQHSWASFQRIVIVDSVQDPGNLGTLIRTADAARFDGIVLGEGTVDVYNEKVVRATQGSLFHLPIFQANLLEKIPELQGEGFDVWASTLTGAVPYHTVAVPDKVALILGNEGEGIAEAVIEQSDQLIKIPIYGQAESLNVSVASGILMYYVANHNQ